MQAITNLNTIILHTVQTFLLDLNYQKTKTLLCTILITILTKLHGKSEVLNDFHNKIHSQDQS